MVSDSLLTILSPVAFGSLSGFHISIPLLICYRRFLFQGRRAGVIASIGTVVGQITFVSFLTVFGSRSFAFFWYVGEPFLQLLDSFIPHGWLVGRQFLGKLHLYWSLHRQLNVWFLLLSVSDAEVKETSSLENIFLISKVQYNVGGMASVKT